MKATLQEQARALGDPTRHDIFRYVVDADDAVDVAELTDYFGLNHNAIRQHLAKLVDAQLVEEHTAAAAGRGRPRLLYRVAPSVDGRWGVMGPYERLSLLLGEIVRTGDTPAEVGRRSVDRQHSDDGDPVDVVLEEMARGGFDPVARKRGGKTEIVLRQCPFETAARTDPEIVCSLHLGMAQGVAELTGNRVVVDDLEPRDPRRAGCRLHLRVES